MNKKKKTIIALISIVILSTLIFLIINVTSPNLITFYKQPVYKCLYDENINESCRINLSSDAETSKFPLRNTPIWTELEITENKKYSVEVELFTSKEEIKRAALVQVVFLNASGKRIEGNYKYISKSDKLSHGGNYFYLSTSEKTVTIRNIIAPRNAIIMRLGFRLWYARGVIEIKSDIIIKPVK